MVIADNRQREMPVPEDRMKPRAEELAYPEAMLLLDPTDPKFKGEVRNLLTYICIIYDLLKDRQYVVLFDSSQNHKRP